MKKHNSFLTALSLFFAIALGAQSWETAYSGGSAGIDRVKGNFTDKNGNTYSTGHYQGTATFGSVTLTPYGSPGYDIFVTKYDDANNLVWARKAGSASGSDEGLDVTVDDAGDIYVVGRFQSTASFTGILNTFTIISTGSYDGFMAKYSPAGELYWVKNLCTSTFSSSLQQIQKVAMSSNRVIYAGVTSSSANITGGGSVPQGAFVGATDINGNPHWAYPFSTVTSPALGTIDNIGLATDRFRQIYVCASSGSATNAVGSNTTIPLANPSALSTVYARYDYLGVLYWARVSSGSSAMSSEGQSIACSYDGTKLIMSGAYSGGSIGFAGTSTLPAVSGLTINGFIVELNSSNGNGIWAYHKTNLADGPRTDVCVTPCGNIYEVFTARTVTQMTSSSGTTNLAPSSPNIPALGIVSYNLSGALLNFNRINRATGAATICSYKKDLHVGSSTTSTTVTTGSGTISITAAGYDALFARYDDPSQPNVAAFATQPHMVCYQYPGPPTTNYAYFGNQAITGSNCGVTWWIYYPPFTGSPTYPWVPANWLCSVFGLNYIENLYHNGDFAIENPTFPLFMVATIECDCGSAISDILAYDCSNPFILSGPLFRLGNQETNEPKEFGGHQLTVFPNPSSDGHFVISMEKKQTQQAFEAPAPNVNLPSGSLPDATTLQQMQNELTALTLSENIEIEVLDAMGRVIIQKTKMTDNQGTINLADAPSGIYLLRMSEGLNTKVYRLIKQ